MSTATPFTKILIANRGEIALRIQRTARQLGYRTVAVYSTADANARHVREADQTVCIGEPLPAQSYLRIDALIDAAKRTGADAVHPGYGFLAEKEQFAQACRDASLVFIGPSPEAILAMGNKARAKALMIEAGVPCIPGYQGDQDAARLRTEAGRIGYPVMIKAVAGGGGRGMRLVTRGEDFDAALRSAQSEAQGAFGDGTVLLEKAIVDPRHIEIQVFADRHGNAIHLGERDCSVQRRHQKVIEEAPSPAVSVELRQRMGATAVKAALAIRYEGAGTLEFLLDSEGRYYFMEMNTRLQVEHSVTESITGLDLVEMQLRVAAGEPLGLKQEDVRFQGHSIEVRLCAEDADKGFVPQSGHMELWRMPADCRVEHALQSGDEIPPYYDSMIAKAIVHGRTRDDARRRLAQVLDDAVALGVNTNRAFLARCLRHPVFAAGGATTGFIAAQLPSLLERNTSDDVQAFAVASALLYSSTTTDSGIAPRFNAALRVEINATVKAVDLQRQGDGVLAVTVGGTSLRVRILERNAQRARVEIDGAAEWVDFAETGSALHVQFRGQDYQVADRSRSATASGPAASDGRIRASMNGRVVAVHAKPGDPLKAGQPVFTLEAMKMEHTHTAPVAGTLKLLHAAVGDQIAAAHVVVEIEKEAA
jgi:geranyl-CoA carboxylase alpha subunit